jgi:hypothetical protein
MDISVHAKHFRQALFIQSAYPLSLIAPSQLQEKLIHFLFVCLRNMCDYMGTARSCTIVQRIYHTLLSIRKG